MFKELDLSTAIIDLLHSGLRAWAKGLTFVYKNTVYGVYFVKFKSTVYENRDGRYN